MSHGSAVAVRRRGACAAGPRISGALPPARRRLAGGRHGSAKVDASGAVRMCRIVLQSGRDVVRCAQRTGVEGFLPPLPARFDPLSRRTSDGVPRLLRQHARRKEPAHDPGASCASRSRTASSSRSSATPTAASRSGAPRTSAPTSTSLLEGIHPLSADYGKLERFFNAYSAELELDAAGRVMVPAKLLEKAGLGKEVAVIGAGNRLEVWDREAWQRARARRWSTAVKEIGPGSRMATLLEMTSHTRARCSPAS